MRIRRNKHLLKGDFTNAHPVAPCWRTKAAIGEVRRSHLHPHVASRHRVEAKALARHGINGRLKGGIRRDRRAVGFVSEPGGSALGLGGETHVEALHSIGVAGGVAPVADLGQSNVQP